MIGFSARKILENKIRGISPKYDINNIDLWSTEDHKYISNWLNTYVYAFKAVENKKDNLFSLYLSFCHAQGVFNINQAKVFISIIFNAEFFDIPKLNFNFVYRPPTFWDFETDSLIEEELVTLIENRSNKVKNTMILISDPEFNKKWSEEYEKKMTELEKIVKYFEVFLERILKGTWSIEESFHEGDMSFFEKEALLNHLEMELKNINCYYLLKRFCTKLIISFMDIRYGYTLLASIEYSPNLI